jgi:hypothetical protein
MESSPRRRPPSMLTATEAAPEWSTSSSTRWPSGWRGWPGWRGRGSRRRLPVGMATGGKPARAADFCRRPPPWAADGVGHLFDLLFLTPATTPSPCCVPNLLFAASELPLLLPLR